jgi:hypothetical protein
MNRMIVSIARSNITTGKFSSGPCAPQSGRAKPMRTTGSPSSSCNVATTGTLPPPRMSRTSRPGQRRSHARTAARMTGWSRSVRAGSPASSQVNSARTVSGTSD